ncbi:MAG: Phosphatidylglycerol/phosphatidylinositol transfer protein [Peltula sp. TS41687]|nr:MAG: Phosphatidylglycerol/phosphatidylinositol transfer protein [Peltula sp. TS41687]
MKLLSTTLCLSLSILSALAGPLSVFSRQQTLSSDQKLPVPGDNPFLYCNAAAQSSPVITIEHLNVNPNPPQRGQNLTIDAVGVVHEEIQEGAYADVSVYIVPLHIRLLQKRFDLCDLVGDVDLKCPIHKGESAVEKTVELPVEIPPAKFQVLVEAYNADGSNITCLTAEVDFRPSFTEL